MPYFTADERLVSHDDTFIVSSIQFKVVHVSGIPCVFLWDASELVAV